MNAALDCAIAYDAFTFKRVPHIHTFTRAYQPGEFAPWDPDPATVAFVVVEQIAPGIRTRTAVMHNQGEQREPARPRAVHQWSHPDRRRRDARRGG
jgi:hypothetical protein